MFTTRLRLEANTVTLNSVCTFSNPCIPKKSCSHHRDRLVLSPYRSGKVFLWKNWCAGIYGSKILKGANSDELAVALPTTFELMINLGTTKALGLSRG